jgi:hypothetical protein
MPLGQGSDKLWSSFYKSDMTIWKVSAQLIDVGFEGNMTSD